MTMDEKNKFIEEYIRKTAAMINTKFNKEIVYEKKIKIAINMFKDSQDDLETVIIPKIDELAQKVIEDYIQFQKNMEENMLRKQQEENSQSIQEQTKPEVNQSVQQNVQNTPKVKESFAKRSQDEIQVHNQIKEKNAVIKNQKAEQRQMNKPKVKTLTKPTTNGNNSSSKSGYANTILLALILSFFTGAFVMMVYMLLKG